jgi:hypothetical protein
MTMTLTKTTKTLTIRSLYAYRHIQSSKLTEYMNIVGEAEKRGLGGGRLKVSVL